MKFAYIQKGNYRIGQTIDVQGKQMIVESYSHTGKNIIAHSLPGAHRFERIICVVTESTPIIEDRGFI